MKLGGACGDLDALVGVLWVAEMNVDLRSGLQSGKVPSPFPQVGKDVSPDTAGKWSV